MNLLRGHRTLMTFLVLALGILPAGGAGAQEGPKPRKKGAPRKAPPAAPTPTMAERMQFGIAVAGAGDLNGDGVRDLLVASYAALGDHDYPRGARAWAFSGKDGAVLRKFTGMDGTPDSTPPLAGEGEPSVASAGDLDGDGVPDILVGAPLTSPGGLRQAGMACAFSGKDGKVLWTGTGKVAGEQFGRSVAGGSDLDGDGAPDIAVGVPLGAPGGLKGIGAVRLYSGKTGLLLREIRETGLGAGDRCVVLPGDLDGDGRNDIAVGGAGQVRAFSGRTGGLLFFARGPEPAPVSPETFDPDDHGISPWPGYSLASAGDTDGDGRPDLVTGTLFAVPRGRSHAGAARLLSGKDGSDRWQVLAPEDAENASLYGAAVAGIGDVDGDRVPDIAVGAPFAGLVQVLSGKDGKGIRTVGGKGTRHFGHAVAAAGDIDGDGTPDILVGDPAWPDDTPGTGRALVISGKDGSVLRTLLPPR